MLEETTEKGVWFLPEDPENRFTGTLEIVPGEDARVELVGSFYGPSLMFGKDLPKPPIILGIVESNRAVTLHNNVCLPRTVSNSGYSASVVMAREVYYGHHFEREEDIVFDRAYARYLDLNAWANTHGFEIDLSRFQENEVRIGYKRPDGLRAQLRSFQLSVEHEFSGPSLRIVQDRVEIKQNTWIGFTYDNPQVLEKVRSDVDHVQSLLTLAMGEQSAVVELKANVHDSSQKGAIQVVVFYPQLFAPRRAKELLPQKMRFALPDISENLGDVFSRWFERKEVLKTVFDLYFHGYARSVYQEQKFLTLVQALETYHRHTFDNQDVPLEEHRIRIRSILEACPEDHREWLDAELRHSNEPSLKRRLKELLSSQKEALDMNKDSRNRIAWKAASTRNRYSHYAKNEKCDEHDILQGDELHESIRVSKSLVEAILLSEIGFGQQRIRSMLG